MHMTRDIVYYIAGEFNLDFETASLFHKFIKIDSLITALKTNYGPYLELRKESHVLLEAKISEEKINELCKRFYELHNKEENKEETQ